MGYKKKLIEVALPLEIINSYSKRKGFHTGIHTYWARRPIGICKAVILASLLDDPSNSLPEKEANKERKRLFGLIERVVKEDVLNTNTLNNVRTEMLKSCGRDLPAIVDPFCGGGSIPLSAQLLGLDGYGSDLNPIAVLINKAILEIPHRFEGKPPVNPRVKGLEQITGNPLILDLEYYGKKLLELTTAKCQDLYEKTPNGEDIDIFIWCRTIKCSNPICGVEVPLVTQFLLSEKNQIYAKPVYSGKSLSFEIVNHEIQPTKTGRGSNFKCYKCSQLLPGDYVKVEGVAKRMRYALVAGMVRKKGKKIYRALNSLNLPIVQFKDLDVELPDDPRNIWTKKYGLTMVSDLFTKRQLYVLKTLNTQLSEVVKIAEKDASAVKSYSDIRDYESGGDGAKAYGQALAIYLSTIIADFAEHDNAQCRWRSGTEMNEEMFSRQVIQMHWDFAEVNPFVNDNFAFINKRIKALSQLPMGVSGGAKQLDASATFYPLGKKAIVSTDPPYYDNIMYANLSDFFYPIHRNNLKLVFPSLFSTMSTPKDEEIVSNPYQFDGDKDKAKDHFKDGMTRAFEIIRNNHDSRYPLTIYYAYKQSENEEGKDDSTSSTGWETMLESLIENRFNIVGTLPFRTEQASRLNALTTNTLAASIVIVCRPRDEKAPLATRRELLQQLKTELPKAVKALQDSGIAPVDMAQAAIGPGISVFSRYSKVLEAEGSQMSVKTALQLINKELDEFLTHQEADMDNETRFCIAWFEQHQWDISPFGDANTLANAKGTASNALEEAGLFKAKTGKCYLVKIDDLQKLDFEKKITVWGATHQLIKLLDSEGETATASALRRLGGVADSVKELAYRLYSICERKGWAEDAQKYNTLISSWDTMGDLAVRDAKRITSAKDKSQRKITEEDW
ncbi:MAG: DUF1156 domain-containing protein [Candidatus Micrarchaeota archaeon]|nr:DUF1156 domain-containing protein [Candidatus Micrarchaeota archaeon]